MVLTGLWAMASLGAEFARARTAALAALVAAQLVIFCFAHADEPWLRG